MRYLVLAILAVMAAWAEEMPTPSNVVSAMRGYSLPGDVCTFDIWYGVCPEGCHPVSYGFPWFSYSCEPDKGMWMLCQLNQETHRCPDRCYYSNGHCVARSMYAQDVCGWTSRRIVCGPGCEITMDGQRCLPMDYT